MTAGGFFFAQLGNAPAGPGRKVRDQVDAFRKSGIDMELVEAPFDDQSFFRKCFLMRQIVSRLPFTYVYSRLTYDARFRERNVYYIRYLALDAPFMRFLKTLRQNRKDAVIILELPDYPLHIHMKRNALTRLIYAPVLLKHRIYLNRLQNYVDRIAHLLDDSEVFHIPTIRFRNGISVNRIRQKKPTGQVSEIHAIAVAGMIVPHGYDRFIEGMHRYYKAGGKRRIIFHVVGGSDSKGNELPKYRSMCEQYGLEEHIVFYGERRGEELDGIYDLCNLGIAPLGAHRFGWTRTSALKVGEYMAKGLPIITSSPVDVIEAGDFRYYYECPGDESPINMEDVITFFDSVYAQGEEPVMQNIRSYAEQYADISAGMEPIFRYIKQKIQADTCREDCA